MRYLGALVASLMLAGQAQAVTYMAQLRGVVSQQIDPSFSDPRVKVGDVYRITAHFDDSMLAPWYSDDGSELIAANTVHLGGAPLGGPISFKVTGSGFTWSSLADRLVGPRLFFEDGKISGWNADLLPAETSAQPGIESYGPTLGRIYGGDNVDLNNYPSPGFWVKWDFAGSKVTAVPEPGSWAMMIAGFGLVGLALRKRRLATAH